MPDLVISTLPRASSPEASSSATFRSSGASAPLASSTSSAWSSRLRDLRARAFRALGARDGNHGRAGRRPPHPHRKIRADEPEDAEAKLGRALDELFPRADHQIMQTLLFPHQVIHVENLGGAIDDVPDRRIEFGCFPWRFQGVRRFRPRGRVPRPRLSPSIPFENLDPYCGIPVSVVLDDVADKLVARRRGGYCFEHSPLMKAALEALGAEVDLRMGRVRWGRGPVRRGRASGRAGPPVRAGPTRSLETWCRLSRYMRLNVVQARPRTP